MRWKLSWDCYQKRKRLCCNCKGPVQYKRLIKAWLNMSEGGEKTWISINKKVFNNTCVCTISTMTFPFIKLTFERVYISGPEWTWEEQTDGLNGDCYNPAREGSKTQEVQRKNLNEKYLVWNWIFLSNSNSNLQTQLNFSWL